MKSRVVDSKVLFSGLMLWAVAAPELDLAARSLRLATLAHHKALVSNHWERGRPRPR